ncbi:hypothetical protein QP868_02155 [Brevibacterium sp. UMB1308A]|nr:hypothetical protein [Brevibacterium sp. UMB1308B]MDK8712701.1 hypothetical protein [Brevibacterium sp. UMB1308A]
MRKPVRRREPGGEVYEYEPNRGVSKHRDGAVKSHRDRPSSAKMRWASSMGDMSNAYIDGSQMGVRDWELEWPEEFPVHVRKATPEEIEAARKRTEKRRP